MSMPIHVEIEGEVQGAIEGNCEMAGREGTILVDGFDHQIYIPTDPQSGASTGKRVHGPVTIIAELDKAAPKLYLALTTGELLTTVTFKWFRQAQAIEEHYFTTVLENAVITSQRAYFPNVLDQATAHYPHLVELQMVYQKVIWMHEIDGIESEDDWLAPPT